MTVENAISYIFGILNVVAFYTMSVCRQTMKTYAGMEMKIDRNLKFAYKAFGHSLPCSSIHEAAFRMSTDTILSLHRDGPLLRKKRDRLLFIQIWAIVGFIIIIVATIMSIFLRDFSLFKDNPYLSMAIPGAILIIEIILLWMSLNYEKAIEKYEKQIDWELESYASLGPKDE